MKSIWEKETFFAPQDVIIVGSGFVGLWSAFYLKKKKPRLKISIIDSGLIPTGASTRNAGFACFGSLSEIVHDARTMGTDQMLQLVEMRYRGLEIIQKHFKKTIDFDLCGGYELYDDAEKKSSAQLHEEITYINSLLTTITGAKKTYKFVDEKITKFGFGNTSHLIKNELEGYLHPGKLVRSLLQTVQGMGVQVFNNIEALSFENGENIINIKTNQHIDLSTDQLLICTNAFTKKLLPEIDIVPARGQILLTSSIDDLPWKGSFHSDEGFYYFRNLGNKVLLGGARNKAFAEETTTDMNTSELIQSELENYLDETILPQFRGQYRIEQRWSGIMAMGKEKKPIVEQVQPNIFCAVRMSGMGVALAPVVAQKIAKMMM